MQMGVSIVNVKLKMVCSMIVFGTMSIFVKNIPLSSGEIALFRAIIAMLAIISYQFIRGKKIKLPSRKKDALLLLLSGAAMGFNWIFLFEAYQYTAVSIATLSYYFAPVIVMIVCPILFKEKLTLKQMICFVMCTVGLVLVIGVGGLQRNITNLIGIAFGLSAAVLYATIILLNKFIKEVDGIDRTLMQFFAAIIVLVPYLGMTGGIHIGKIGSIGLINLLIIGIVHTGMMYCMYFSSLKQLKGQEAAVLGYIDPLVAIIVSVSVLGESIDFTQIVGGILILGFTLLNELDIQLFQKKTSQEI